MNSIELQRLVDGELSLNETQDLLRRTNECPEHWRTMAMAFVEDQICGAEFRRLDSVDQHAQRNQMPEAALSTGRQRGDGAGRWLALAASALLALGVGYLVGGQLASRSANVAASPDLSVSDLANSENDSQNLNQSPAVYRMQLQDAAGNRYVDSEVPLYSIGNSDLEKYIDDEAVTKRQRRTVGAEIGTQRNVRYLSGRLKDGRRFVVPMRNSNSLQIQ